MFKKMIKVLGLSLLAISVFTACSDDDDPASPTTYESIFVHWMNDSTEVSFKDMTTTDLNGETVIGLQNFITDAIVPQDVNETFVTAVDEYEARQLYAYHIIGEDGFSASGVKGYPNNSWYELGKGYINFESRDVSFPDVPEENFDIAGAYNIKATKHIMIKRKFDVFMNDSVNAFFELDNMPVETVLNFDNVNEDAIPLKSFVDSLVAEAAGWDTPVVIDPSAHFYNMSSADDYGPTDSLTWTQLQTGFWLKDSQKTIFTDPELRDRNRYKLKFLENIIVYEL